MRAGGVNNMKNYKIAVAGTGARDMSIPIAQSLIGYTHSICHFSFWQQVGCIKKNQF